MQLSHAPQFEIVAVNPTSSGRIPWWLWLNLLSLDAPLIALLWQEAFARAFHMDLTLATRVILVFTVWMIYAADRILDARQGACETARHAFHQKHCRAFGMLCTVVLIVTAASACFFLQESVFIGGLLLLSLVTVYFALVHGRANWKRHKEWAVAVVFAAGVSLAPLSASMPGGPGIFAVLLFAILCWINCEGIERWGRRTGSLSGACMAVGCGSLVLAIRQPQITLVLFLSAAALFVLDQMHARFSAEAVRVLADATLLSPLLILFVR